jgi:hypothetical protein
VAQIGVTSAPVPRGNIRTALQFFARHMMRLPPDMALNFLRAMDLSRPVRSLTLAPSETVIAFRLGNESPFKLFYTRPGASKFTSGINPGGRSIVRFQVRAPAPALESYTTGAIDVWTVPAEGQPTTVAPRGNTTGVMALGGAIQLIIPNSPSLLTMI